MRSAALWAAASAVLAAAGCMYDVPDVREDDGAQDGGGAAPSSASGSTGPVSGSGSGAGGAGGGCAAVCPDGTTCQGTYCVVPRPTADCGAAIDASAGGVFLGNTCGGLDGISCQPTVSALLFRFGAGDFTVTTDGVASWVDALDVACTADLDEVCSGAAQNQVSSYTFDAVGAVVWVALSGAPCGEVLVTIVAL